MGINNSSSTWITGEKSRMHCHNLRSMTDAILIGRNTAFVDNPSLTVRDVLGHNPKRIILLILIGRYLLILKFLMIMKLKRFNVFG